MYTDLKRRHGLNLFLGLALAGSLGVLSSAQAAVVTYTVNLSGPNESPPNASPGTGSGIVEVDAVAHTLRVSFTFAGLTAGNTACHIHAATAVPGTGTAGVATTTPTFTGFPTGVTAGAYDHTFDTTLTTSFNPAYVTAHGGTAAQAETDLFLAIAQGRAYLNLHSSTFPGGEIRGFLAPTVVSTREATWAQVKSLFQ